MLAIILVLTVILPLVIAAKEWRNGPRKVRALWWQVAMYGLIVVACSILVFLDFGLSGGNLSMDAPAEASRALQVQKQRVDYGVVAMSFAAAGSAIYLFKIRRYAVQ